MRLILLTVTSIASPIHAQEEWIARVEQILPSRLQQPSSTPFDHVSVQKILDRPDPGTFFLRYAYGLQRQADRLLDGEQARRLAKVLEDRQPVNTRWHDERNTLRCKYNEVMWRYVGSSEPEAGRLRRELEKWMRLRMVWTQQEHLAQYRFARDVWTVLDPQQQSKLIAGDWKELVKLDTGHTRGDATARIITRALGEPDDRKAFDAQSSAWSRERMPLHAAVVESENKERRIVFAMDLNSESMAHAACEEATAAYAKLFLAEANAMQRIVWAGYRQPASKCAQAAEVAWSEAEKRFLPGAEELISLLRQP